MLDAQAVSEGAGLLSAEAIRAATADEITAILMAHIQQDVDLARFAGSWNIARSN